MAMGFFGHLPTYFRDEDSTPEGTTYCPGLSSQPCPTRHLTNSGLWSKKGWFTLQKEIRVVVSEEEMES